MIESRLFCEFRDEANNRSFEELYHMTRPWLYRVIYRIVGDRMDTEDILHNTWEKVIERGNKFDPAKGRFNNYIFSIGKNEALMWKIGSNKSRQAMMAFADAANYNNYQEPDNSMELMQSSKLIQKILRKLSSGQQDCILLFYFAGMRVKDISSILNMPEGQVKSLLSRGREKLRSIILVDKYSDSLYLFDILL